jgi:hypothetical protein
MESYTRNDIILPEYNPLSGKTDFLDDKHLYYLKNYYRFLLSLDKVVGLDVRNKLEAYSYE